MPVVRSQAGAATAALLGDEALEDVGHAQWVFTMPKMPRPDFRHHRWLLGGLTRSARQTVLEILVTAADEQILRPEPCTGSDLRDSGCPVAEMAAIRVSAVGGSRDSGNHMLQQRVRSDIPSDWKS